MGNFNRPENWKADIKLSVDYYNNWFLTFAPTAYRTARQEAIQKVQDALIVTDYFRDLNAQTIRKYPFILSVLRMSTIPPLARDRLIGLAQTTSSIVKRLEEGNLPKRSPSNLNEQLEKISHIITKLIDKDIFSWLNKAANPTKMELLRASSVVADRVCCAVSDPIIRNAQEKRQLDFLTKYLINLGYNYIPSGQFSDFRTMPQGCFTFHLNISANVGERNTVNIPIDAVIKRKNDKNHYPLLIECKSAGDFTNTNKRRKEEAIKILQLRNTYGDNIEFILFLCGYFDTGYLGYEAAEGIDWIWEHRINDLEIFNI